MTFGKGTQLKVNLGEWRALNPLFDGMCLEICLTPTNVDVAFWPFSAHIQVLPG